jgi:hypothetical protein
MVNICTQNSANTFENTLDVPQNMRERRSCNLATPLSRVDSIHAALRRQLIEGSSKPVSTGQKLQTSSLKASQNATSPNAAALLPHDDGTDREDGPL